MTRVKNSSQRLFSKTFDLAAISASLISLILIMRSASSAYLLSLPVPFYDQWDFLRTAPAFFDGRYGLHELFSQHNEHIIFTSRLVFLIDLVYADGSSYLCDAVFFLLLTSIAVSIACITTKGSFSRVTVGLVCLGLLCSPAQWENFASGFQIQFPFVDLFFIASFFFLLRAEGSTSPLGTTGFSLLATFFDFLTVFSMASGVLSIVPITALRVYGGIRSRPFWLFFFFHLIYIGLFFRNYRFDSGIGKVFDPVELTHYVIVYLGSGLRGIPHGPFSLGSLSLVAFLAASISSLVKMRQRAEPPDRMQILLLGIMLMMICNGYVTAHGRASLGIETAIASRYAIQSLLFQAALFGFAWRSFSMKPVDLRIVAIACTTAISIASNTSRPSRLEWESRHSALQIAGAAMANHVWSENFLAMVYPAPERIHDVLDFMAERRIGPFSPSFGRVFDPVANALANVDVDGLEACAASIGSSHVSADGATLEGWIFDRTEPAGNGYLLVYDGTSRHPIGFGRQSIPRADVDQALKVSAGNSGFELGIAFDPSPSKPHALTIVLVPEASSASICKATQIIDVSP